MKTPNSKVVPNKIICFYYYFLHYIYYYLNITYDFTEFPYLSPINNLNDDIIPLTIPLIPAPFITHPDASASPFIIF